MSERSVIVSLTGGLGNQLFQFAQALASNPNRIWILSSLGRPRSTNGKPDLLHFALPWNCVPVKKGDAPQFIQKVAGFMLRKGIQRRGLENFFIINVLLDSIANLILILYLKRRFTLSIGKGVGYSRIKNSKRQLLIGYFQHGRHLNNSEFFDQLRRLVPLEIPNDLSLLIAKAKLEKPIFVHYRLTDYLKEDTFGVPSANYYTSALRKLNARDRKIWVFSDDLEMAEDILPEEFASNAFFISEQSFNSAQWLQLFRYGKDFVIANSSFSWWGAALRFDCSGIVFAPTPWFKELPEPIDLIPNDWVRLGAE